ncbi:MAG: MFS transporter [Thermoleophilia bacterium]|nr:MFS transporter [Thermoleophilia bacterium]
MAPETATLRSLLEIPDVGRTMAASLAGRLPYTAIELLLILRVRELGGGYAEGGAVAAGFALGLAGVSPLVGRLVDRRGQAAVLLPAAAICATALVLIALIPDSTPLAVIVGLAALAGMAHPPLGGATRALWPDLVPSERRHAIYALEAAGVELTFVVGPLILVGVVAALTSPSLGLLVCAALLVSGTTAFATMPSSRRWRPAGVARTLAGALANPSLLVMLGTVACIGASFGAIEIATTAHADEHGSAALVGPLLATWALGSLIGGLLLARGRPPADPARRLVLLLGATAAADALVAAAPGPLLLGAALLAAGACIAPAFATLYAMVADLASEGTLTESYTWLMTGIALGVAVGSAGGGALVDAVSTHAALGMAAGMVAVATLIAASGLGRLRREVAAA